MFKNYGQIYIKVLSKLSGDIYRLSALKDRAEEELFAITERLLEGTLTEIEYRKKSKKLNNIIEEKESEITNVNRKICRLNESGKIYISKENNVELIRILNDKIEKILVERVMVEKEVFVNLSLRFNNLYNFDKDNNRLKTT